MAKPELVLATADQVREIAERAFASLESQWDEEDDVEPEQRELSHERFEASKDALRFACSAAMLLRDPSLIDVVVRSLLIIEEFNDDESTAKGRVAQALEGLLRAGAPLTDQVRELVNSKDPELRYALASGLRCQGHEGQMLLQKLLSDPRSEVRVAARASLGDQVEAPWWKGKFDSDPLESLTEDEALACKDALHSLSQLLDEPWWKVLKQAQELVELAGKLPPQLALELLRNTMLATEPLHVKDGPIGPAFMRLPHALEALQPLLVSWSQELRHAMYLGKAVGGWLAQLPDEVSTGICTQMLEMVRAAEPMHGERDFRFHDRFMAMADALAAGWPPSADVGAVIDVVLGLPSGDARDLRSRLAAILERKDISFEPIVERLVSAKLLGYPGEWRALGYRCDALLRALPAERLRPIAESAARADDDGVARWGWEQLVGPLHRPEVDGSLEELVGRMLNDPRCRKFVFDNSIGKLALDSLREELRGRRLDFGEARRVIELIGSCYGGVVGPISWISREIPLQLSTEKPQLPHRLQGPPTELEWNVFRELRERAIVGAESSVLYEATAALPDGPWAEEDLPVLRKLIEAYRSGADRGDIQLAYMLASKPSADAVALFDELLRASNEDKWIRRCQRAALRELGILLPGAGQGERTDDDDGWGDEEG